MKIGFTKGHEESIWPGEYRKYFTKLIAFIEASGVKCVGIEDRLSKNALDSYNAVVLGAPTRKLHEPELEEIRRYVNDGGNLFVILKFGSDHRLRTNTRRLFPEVTPRNDEVRDPDIPIMNHVWHFYDQFKAVIPVEVNHPDLHFKGRILYDGGCTFETQGEVEIEISPPEDIISHPQPPAGRLAHYGSGYIQNRTSEPAGPIFVRKKIGKGYVNWWGARWSFSDEHWDSCYGNSSFMRAFLPCLIGGDQVFRDELERRMKEPQRHRLLHGYPMSRGMKPIPKEEEVQPDEEEINEQWRKPVKTPPTWSDIEDFFQYIISSGRRKKLAVGVIPHPCCTTLKEQCGYCSFPCEKYSVRTEAKSIRAVMAELWELEKRYPEITKRPVSSLYFGGGTANLTSHGWFKELCHALNTTLQIGEKTELTLEGTPKYFSTNKVLLNLMKEFFPKSRLRVSIGVQTFDQDILKKAGRSVLNEEGSVEKAVETAREMGFKVSCDMLFNLPGQRSFSTIKPDLDRIVNLGVEHICWYHLVAFPGMNTPWSRDPEIMQALPNRTQALENWNAVYNAMADAGYEAVTLTDFKKKRSGIKGSYQYEEDLRRPENVDWLGLGPYAISVFSNFGFPLGIKLMNPSNLDEYVKRQEAKGTAWDRFFCYDSADLQLYWVTRHIKGTGISRKKFKSLFKRDIEFSFGHEIRTLEAKGLLKLDNQTDTYQLTPEGFFYADSVAGLISWLRVNEITTWDMQTDGFWNSAICEWMG